MYQVFNPALHVYNTNFTNLLDGIAWARSTSRELRIPQCVVDTATGEIMAWFVNGKEEK